MTILITLGVILTSILGFGLSALLVNGRLQDKNKTTKGMTFIMLGNIFSVCVMALAVFIVWPA